MQSPIPVVFDHFGGAQASAGTTQAGFDSLVGLVKSGKAYVKVSGAYRSSSQRPDYPDVAPLAKALIAANPQRILWGSDWPHPDSARVDGRQTTDIAPLIQIDDGRLLNELPMWAADAALRKTSLSTTQRDSMATEIAKASRESSPSSPSCRRPLSAQTGGEAEQEIRAMEKL
jgi:hypothetical protein